MKRLILITLLASLLLLAGCSQSIKDIKEDPDKYLGKTVILSGEASASIKLGKLSGFTLNQDDGSKIAVSSETLPKDGAKVVVHGTVMKDSLFGTYILAKDVRT